MDNLPAQHKPNVNTSTLPQQLQSGTNLQIWKGLVDSERWKELSKFGQFDETKAQSSLLALPDNLPRVRPSTPEQAMLDIFPTLATVRKYHGENGAKAAIVDILSRTAAMLNVGKQLQPHQVEFLADEILLEYYWLNIGELRYLFLQGTRGEYGTVYDRFDSTVVFGWIGKYLEVRAEIASNKAQRGEAEQEAKFKAMPKSETATTMPDGLKEALSKLENKFIVSGTPKSGIVSGEFEPDAPTLRMIEEEWADQDEALRPPFENYKAMRIAQLKTSLKK